MARRVDNRTRAEAAKQLLCAIRVGQIGAPPFLDRVARERKLPKPIRYRYPVSLRLADEVSGNANLTRALDNDVDERDSENEPDQQCDEQWYEHPFAVPGKR